MKSSVRILLLACLAFSVCPLACRNEDSTSQASAATPEPNDLPKLDLDDDTRDLLLTWVDSKGDFHVVQRIADVPDAGREQVRVVLTRKEEGTGHLVYVADLRAKGRDGRYAVKTMTRAQWDEVGAARRKLRLEALAPSAKPSSEPPASNANDEKGAIRAVVYGAEWCKPCHDAARYLRKKGVDVTRKDIEKSDVARKEMQTKLARAGRAGAQIPIIDVMGQILIGFSPRALDRAISAARNAKRL